MRRQSLALGAAVLTGLLLQPLVAQAAPADWAGSKLTTPASTTSASPNITALFVRANTGDRIVTATTGSSAPDGLPEGCANSVQNPTSVNSEGDRHTTSATLTTNCNGTYAITVKATLQSCNPLFCSLDDSHTLSGSIAVKAPAPSPAATTAAPGPERSVLVGWTPVVAPPPDFLGYRVERVSASGTTVTLATIDDATASSYTDPNPPAEGGNTTYKVYGRRAGPSGEVSSTASSASTEVEPGPVDTTDPAGPPGDGGTGGDPGTPGAGDGATAGGGSSGGRSSSVRSPRVGSSRNFFPPLLSPPETVTGGAAFSADDREPGEEDPVLPEDALSVGNREAAPGRGLAIPVATAMVLAVWAFHLRFLAQVATPELVDERDLPHLTEW